LGGRRFCCSMTVIAYATRFGQFAVAPELKVRGTFEQAAWAPSAEWWRADAA